MIGVLPTTLNINGLEAPINTDFRIALLIFEAINDKELSAREKTLAMIQLLYTEWQAIPITDYDAAIKQAAWYLDGGKQQESNGNQKPIMDWEHDEQMIFSSINKVAGTETRALDYMHWWTFLGYFAEIDEKSLFTQVVQIRQKRNKGKKLEKWEAEFYKKHKKLIDLPKRRTAEQQAEIDRLNAILNGNK